MFSIWSPLQNYEIFWQNSSIFSKHFSVVSRLLLGWHDVATPSNVKSSLKLRALDKIETVLLFWASSFKTLINVETTLWPFTKFEKDKKIFLSFKKKMTELINNTGCRLWSIKKKGKNETCNVKINVGKYNGCYMKRIHIVKKQHMYFSLYSLFLFFHIIL